MKAYEKPIIILNEELAEGVYATGLSGGNPEGDCWVWWINSTERQYQEPTQYYTPTDNNVATRIHGEHLAQQHITLACKLVIPLVAPADYVDFDEVQHCGRGQSVSMGDTVTGKKVELSADGLTITLTRYNHGNAYGVKDETDPIVKTYSLNADAYLSNPDSWMWICTKTTNVQGGGADGH